VVVFGVFAFLANTVRETDEVFVLVDSSFAMQDVWTRVAVELDRIDDDRYSEFALATEKSPVQSDRGPGRRLGGRRTGTVTRCPVIRSVSHRR
jgi:hypothetical protein